MEKNMIPNEEMLKKSLIELATENRKTTQIFHKLLTKADIQDQLRYTNKLNWFMKKTEDYLVNAH